MAIKLYFQENRQPTTSAFTGYYEEFRRTVRAITRKDESKGRVTKDLEAATDFALVDAVVTQPNGHPGQVVLRLGMGDGQSNWEAEQRVRDGLSNVLALAEWADEGLGFDAIPIDDPELRTKVALQARRLLPRRGVDYVELGGKFVSRSKPIQLRADLEVSLLQVASAQAEPEPYDAHHQVRAIDLDRGLILFGKRQRLQCFLEPEQFAHLTEVGVHARIRGRHYRPLMGKPFVLVDEIELDEREDN